jgi:hypothetical protein
MIPAAVTAAYPALPHHPTIREVYQPGTGWTALPALASSRHQHQHAAGNQITRETARQLARAGYTAVALCVGPGRLADFQLTALR